MDSPLTPAPPPSQALLPSFPPGAQATPSLQLLLWLTTRVSYPCGPSGTSKSVRTDRGSVLRMLVQMEFWMDAVGNAWQKGRGEYGGQAADTQNMHTKGRAQSLDPLSGLRKHPSTGANRPSWLFLIKAQSSRECPRISMPKGKEALHLSNPFYAHGL